MVVIVDQIKVVVAVVVVVVIINQNRKRKMKKDAVNAVMMLFIHAQYVASFWEGIQLAVVKLDLIIFFYFLSSKNNYFLF